MFWILKQKKKQFNNVMGLLSPITQLPRFSILQFDSLFRTPACSLFNLNPVAIWKIPVLENYTVYTRFRVFPLNISEQSRVSSHLLQAEVKNGQEKLDRMHSPTSCIAMDFKKGVCLVVP